MNLENGIIQEVLRKGIYNAKENPQTHNHQRCEDLDFR